MFDGFSCAERDYKVTIHTVNWFLSFETWTYSCWIDPRWQILQLWWCNFDVKIRESWEMEMKTAVFEFWVESILFLVIPLMVVTLSSVTYLLVFSVQSTISLWGNDRNGNIFLMFSQRSTADKWIIYILHDHDGSHPVSHELNQLLLDENIKISK